MTTNPLLDRIEEPASRLLELTGNPYVYTRPELDFSATLLDGGKSHQVGLFPLVAALRKGGSVNPHDPRLLTRRQNSTHLMQVGDTLRGGRVTEILVGDRPETARYGEGTMSVNWTLMRTDSFAGKVAVCLKDDLNAGYWRRGTQISPTPSKDPVLEAKLELRHWLRQAKACLRDSRIRRDIGKESGEQILLSSRIVTAIEHELSRTPVHMEPAQALPGERAYLRRRIRDIEALVDRERGREGVFDGFDVWKACNEERNACIEALRDIRRDERHVAKAAVRAMR